MLNPNFDRDLLRVLAEEILPNSLQERWRREEDPKGRKWKKRISDDEPHPLLRKSGEMQDSLRFSVSGNTIFAQTSEIGKFHQYGTRRMVKREWIGLPTTARIEGAVAKLILQ
jgi:hypothetical protein